MTPRTRSLLVLVASTVLLVGSLIGWLGARDGGVGTHLEQVTEASAAAEVDPAAPAPPPPSAEEQPAPPQEERDVPDVPLVDATQIVLPEAVDPPQRLRIPSVDVDMPIRATGVLADGQMQLPKDPNRIGWYEYGPVPGDAQGSAVLGGHVDSLRRGVGPLARLAAVDVGDRVVVTAGDGTRVRYRVTSVRRITKAALPVDSLFRPDGAHQLAVITCGGRYVAAAGGYEDNIVVLARPMA